MGNWCAYVAAGTSREDRLDRLDEVPPNFRDEVAAHVRVYFQVRAEARRQEQGKK